ncbi:starch-binding protein [Ruminococcus sp.]
MKKNKRIISAALAASMLLPCFATAAVSANAVVVSDENSVSAGDYDLMDNIQDGVILHCFNWKYNDIKAELDNIAEAGFTTIQTSPAQPGGGTGTWWWLYQPLGFYIGTNELGTKAELESLCKEAENYGIKVIVDVVANHLAGDHSRIEDDLKPSKYWHTFGGGIDWKNRWQVTHGEIGMPDIATENSYVQQKVGNYMQELKSVGVDGIRWDAAKHIGVPSEDDNFWSSVTKYGLYNYGEILGGPDDRASGNEDIMKEYTDYITVTDSNYGKTLRDSFNSGDAPDSSGNWCDRGISCDKLIYWAESHDTWSNNKDWGYSNDMSQNVIDRAYAVAASRNEVTALYFSRPSSKIKDDIKIGEKGSTHFTSSEVAEVNKFHNAMNGKADCYKKSNDCSVITRKDGGAVIVKGSGSGKVSVENGGGYAKPGTYVDRISGNTFTVTASSISGQVGSSGIAVIYEEENPKPRVSVTPGSSTYETETYTLTLNTTNATSSQYSVDGGKYQSFTDGTKITIGAGLAYGTKTTINVKASNANGSADKTYIYTKVDPTLTQRIYFDNSSYNWSNIYAYIYSDAVSNAKWPGEKMTLDSSTGYYVIEVSDSLANGAVIFSDGTNSASKRYPADAKPGLNLNGATKIFKANHTFEDYYPPVPTQSTTAQPTTAKPTTAQPTTAQPTTSPAESVLIGDTNQDGKITINDVTEIQLYINETITFNQKQKIAADVDEDGSVDIRDATYIMLYIANQPSSEAKVGQYTGGIAPTQPTTVKPTTQPTTAPTPTTQPTTSSVSDKYTMTFTDNYNWGNVNCYYWSDSNTKMTSWPGKSMTKSTTNELGQSVYTIDIPSDAAYVIFNNGSSQTVDIPVTGSAKFYISGSSNGKYTVKN